jgi:hypothetical protein
LAHHDSRNPRFCGSRYSAHPELELVDFRNNVIFNWGSNSAYAGEGGSYNMVNNYYKAGPATSTSSTSRILQPYADSGSNSQPAGVYGKFYIEGNEISNSTAVSSDNWQGVSLHSTFSSFAPTITKNDIKSETEFPVDPVTNHSAQVAYEKVLSYAGASLARDTIDKRIVDDTRTGTAKVIIGGNGSTNGIIDTQSAVGGWPVLNSTPAPIDSDNDGMPDSWENAHSLNKNDPDDAILTSFDDSYPNIEVYLNSLVADITENQNKEGTVTSALRLNKNELMVFFNNSTNELVINHTSKIEKVQLYTITGALIFTENSDQNSMRLLLSNLITGVFVVRVQDGQKKVYADKIVNY